jgi:hypothetical protein
MKTHKEHNAAWYLKNKNKSYAQSRKWKKSNPDKMHVLSTGWYRKNHLKIKERMYGMKEGDLIKLIEKQKGTCAICKKKPKVLVVDHNHKNGKVRGLLCRKCNLGIGHLNDNVAIIKNAIKYLSK